MKSLIPLIFVLTASCEPKIIKKVSDVDSTQNEIQLLSDNHFNVEKNPKWNGIALSLLVQNPLVVQNTDQAFKETKITFRYFVRSALTTSVGPRLIFTSKKTGDVINSYYFKLEKPKSIDGNHESSFHHSADHGFYHEVNETVSLSLSQLEIPRVNDEFDVKLFYGPTSKPSLLEIQLK